MLIDDIYGRAGFVRQWSLDDAGQPHCVLDGLPPGDAGAVAALQRNAAVRNMIGAVEALEAATRAPEPSEAEQATIAAASAVTKALALWRTPEPATGLPISDAWTAWDAARATARVALDAQAAAPLENDPRPVPATISDRQFAQQLAIVGVISEAEALAFVATGTIPAAMNALIAALPTDAQFGAKMLVAGATTYEFEHPLTAALAAAFGWSDAQRADFWRAAALL